MKLLFSIFIIFFFSGCARKTLSKVNLPESFQVEFVYDQHSDGLSVPVSYHLYREKKKIFSSGNIKYIPWELLETRRYDYKYVKYDSMYVVGVFEESQPDSYLVVIDVGDVRSYPGGFGEGIPEYIAVALKNGVALTGQGENGADEGVNPDEGGNSRI